MCIRSRILSSLALVFTFASACALGGPAAAADTAPRVLLVLSSEGRDQGKTRPGYEMDELSQAWAIFRDNGLQVDLASPTGGQVEADKYDPQHPANARFLADPQAMAALADTHATATLKAEDYAAVFVVGGKGAMFDLPRDPALISLIGRIHDRGGVVAAVCHGPAALVPVRTSDGRWLVSGRRVTGFSNEEEAIFGKRWAKEYALRIEDAMRERGASWEEARLMMPWTTVDGRLITGQNPYATPETAEAVVRALGRTPVSRTPDRDEHSMRLVRRLLEGDADGAHMALAASPDTHHPALIGMLGYYQAQVAGEDRDALRDALAIMSLAHPHFAEPQLALAMADAHLRLEQRDQARTLVHSVLATTPDMEQARTLLARIDEHP